MGAMVGMLAGGALGGGLGLPLMQEGDSYALFSLLIGAGVGLAFGAGWGLGRVGDAQDQGGDDGATLLAAFATVLASAGFGATVGELSDPGDGWLPGGALGAAVGLSLVPVIAALVYWATVRPPPTARLAR